MMRREKKPQRGSRHNAFFCEWMASTGAQTSPSSFGGFGSRVHLWSLLTLLSTLPSAADQLHPLKLVVRCWSGRYHHSIPTSLPTTIVPFVEQVIGALEDPGVPQQDQEGSELGRSASRALTATVGPKGAILG
ncbi:hypothetical protein MRX96_047131 [Rhipicephalus microplus]